MHEIEAKKDIELLNAAKNRKSSLPSGSTGSGDEPEPDIDPEPETGEVAGKLQEAPKKSTVI